MNDKFKAHIIPGSSIKAPKIPAKSGSYPLGSTIPSIYVVMILKIPRFF